MKIEYKDKFGRAITPGSIIAYWYALGRSGHIRIGKVVRMTPKKNGCSSTPSYSMTVQGINDDRQGLPLQLTDRKGILKNTERIFVLDSFQIPEAYKTILDKITID